MIKFTIGAISILILVFILIVIFYSVYKLEQISPELENNLKIIKRKIVKGEKFTKKEWNILQDNLSSFELTLIKETETYVLYSLKNTNVVYEFRFDEESFTLIQY